MSLNKSSPFSSPPCFEGSDLTQRADVGEIPYSLYLAAGSGNKPGVAKQEWGVCSCIPVHCFPK